MASFAGKLNGSENAGRRQNGIYSRAFVVGWQTDRSQF
jgi:hypothetical protein